MASLFTCITCRVAFRDLEIQRQHYRSDWHRYNLKRKVGDIPPVTVEEFQRRVIAQRALEDEANSEKRVRCRACRKYFNSENQYENHILSKKHKDNLMKNSNSNSEDQKIECDEDQPNPSVIVKNVHAATVSCITNNESLDTVEVDSDIETVDSEDWYDEDTNPIELNNCLFCDHHSRTELRNLKHMTEDHSFFIPDLEYCIDLHGLLIYLGEKICSGFMCIWCNNTGREFQSAEAARKHMIDKGHCKMLHEGEALVEYSVYYDYSSSYPDANESNADAEVEIPELDDSDYQLVLPSGNIIGHRSLMRYYKQNLNPNSVVAVSKRDKIRKVISQYRALGWTGTQKEVAVKKARDISYMQRIQKKYATKLQFKANKLQKHFRQQVNF